MRILTQTGHALMDQRGHLFPWTPVFLALGIGSYFALGSEPVATVYMGLGLLAMCCIGVALRWPGAVAIPCWAITLAVVGLCVAGSRAHMVADPVLGWRYYGAVEGRIVGLDRSASDALRITLDRVRLSDTAPDRLPARARLSLHGDHPVPNLAPGQRIMTTGHLSPPQGPVEPGGFDFRRHAWFQGLGAVGYTRNPVVTIAPAQDGQAGLRVFAIRMAASMRVQAVLPGDIGGFAAAVTTGDRSAISQDALTALRGSNLAHLLAISGLHMGLLAGFVFGALRLALAAIPPLALRLPVKKVAALGALGAAAAYLALSGGNVATERAFIMVAVVLCAVLVDRRAFSLRAVAMAALIVLLLRPEALLGPGFQMSFAATTALVAVFGWIRDYRVPMGPNWLKPVLGVAISSAVAGLATAPVGAAHFNTLSHYGLIANLMSVPLMGVLVIPAAVLAAVLAPFGLESVGLWPMGLGLRWILWVAESVAALEGAQGHVVGPGPAVLPMLALGALFIILWQGRARWAGVLPVAAAFWLWAATERPELLIADTGGLVGVMTDTGRALSKPRGAGFIARNWLENDGDGAEQAAAASRWAGQGGKIRDMSAGSLRVVHLLGKRAAANWQICDKRMIIVASTDLTLEGDCDIYDPKRLRRVGSVALTKGQIITARDRAGQRIWNMRPTRKRRWASATADQ